MVDFVSTFIEWCLGLAKTDTVCGTDASPFGFGIPNDGKYHLGGWLADVASKHINSELLTVRLVCAVNGPSWQSKKSVLSGADRSTASRSVRCMYLGEG